MPFIGNKPSAVPLASADIADSIITSAKIVDGTIANADIANSTINLTTKVTGTLPVANGGTGLAALGTANQVLATNSGATALEFQSVSSDYVLLATTTASASASVSFNGYYSSTYKNYRLICSSVRPSTGGVDAYIRFRRSNADVTSGNYLFSSRGDADYDSGAKVTDLPMNSGTYGNAWDITILDPLNTTLYKQIFVTGYHFHTNPVYYCPVLKAYMLMDALTALSGITFYFSGANITEGSFKLYGIK
jgi:hypothetical protein